MEPLFHAAPFSGYVYPNETVIPWTVLIVVYPVSHRAGGRCFHHFQPIPSIWFSAFSGTWT